MYVCTAIYYLYVYKYIYIYIHVYMYFIHGFHMEFIQFQTVVIPFCDHQILNWMMPNPSSPRTAAIPSSARHSRNMCITYHLGLQYLPIEGLEPLSLKHTVLIPIMDVCLRNGGISINQNSIELNHCWAVF